MNREEIEEKLIEIKENLWCDELRTTFEEISSFCYSSIDKILSLESQIEELKKERDSLKCCGNCGFNKLYSNGQYEIEQMCGYDHECKTSPDISMSLINHWQPLPEPPKETK